MQGMQFGWEGVRRWLGRGAMLWLLLLLLALFAFDIYEDLLTQEVDLHLLIEALTFLAVLAIIIGEWRHNRRLSFHLEEAAGHRQRLSGQFSEYVRDAFAGWGLSKSEEEIAWLLLKGFTFAEIAALREVREKTVRQQASGIYAKSGCKNRNEFFAYFIQDLLEGEHRSGPAKVPDDGPGDEPGDNAPAADSGDTASAKAAGSALLTSASGRAPE